MVNGTVTKIDVASSNATSQKEPFTVEAKFLSGEVATVGAKTIILATGLSDILPNTPGVKQNWGKGIFWCPVSNPKLMFRSWRMIENQIPDFNKTAFYTLSCGLVQESGTY